MTYSPLGVPFKLNAQDMGVPDFDLFDALKKGQQFSQSNQMFPQDLQAKMLANQIAQVQAQYAQPMAQQSLIGAEQQNKYNPQIWQSEIGLRGAQAGNFAADTDKTRYMLQHPGLMGGEEAKTLQSLMDMGYIPKNNAQAQGSQTPQAPSPDYSSAGGNMGAPPQVQQQPQQMSAVGQIPMPSQGSNVDPSAPFKTGNPMVDAILNKQYAAAAYQRRMTQGFNWVHSPVDAKSYQIAQLAGAGVDPSEAVGLLTSGQTVPEILKAKGFDPNNAPSPDFLPTRGNVQQLKQRQVALKEVDSLGTFVREGLGPYSQTVMGMSPLQVGEALTGQNEDRQAKFLAARMLAPELGNIRLMLAQGKAGITAVDQIMNKSMMNMGAYQSLVTPKVFDKAQRMADKALRDSLTKASEAYTVGKNTSGGKSLPDPLGIR